MTLIGHNIMLEQIYHKLFCLCFFTNYSNNLTSRNFSRFSNIENCIIPNFLDFIFKIVAITIQKFNTIWYSFYILNRNNFSYFISNTDFEWYKSNFLIFFVMRLFWNINVNDRSFTNKCILITDS